MKRMKSLFEKGFHPSWTELFKICTIKYTTPVTYNVQSLDGKEIEAIFSKTSINL